MDEALQNLGIVVCGALILGAFRLVAKLQRLYHDHHDYAATMQSGSRDPKAKLHEIQQSRELKRWQAALIAVAIVALILLCL